MHPNGYPSDASPVGLVGALLTGIAIALILFAPLLEKKSSILENFEIFIFEFQVSFNDIESVRTMIKMIIRPYQRD
jgi:hypothetical protein